MDKKSEKITSFTFLTKFKSSSSNCSSNCKTASHNRNYKAESKAKRSKYNQRKPHKVFADLKNTAYKGLNNVRSGLGTLSQRLKLTSPKAGKNMESSYDQLENNLQTPIKLYSPFGFETASPCLDRKKMRCQRQVFVSPTGKIKDDVKHITNGFNELNFMTDDIMNRMTQSNGGPKTPPPSPSIDLLL